MSFTPFIMTQNGPKVIYPLEKIISKESVKKEDVSSSNELEDKLLHHIAERFKDIETKIKTMSSMASSPPIDLSTLEKEIKKILKEEIKDYLCSDCIKEGQYNIDKKTFNELLENKVKELSDELNEKLDLINSKLSISTNALTNTFVTLKDKVSAMETNNNKMVDTTTRQLSETIKSINERLSIVEQTTLTNKSSSDIIQLKQNVSKLIEEVNTIKLKMPRISKNNLTKIFKDVDILYKRLSEVQKNISHLGTSQRETVRGIQRTEADRLVKGVRDSEAARRAEQAKEGHNQNAFIELPTRIGGPIIYSEISSEQRALEAKTASRAAEEKQRIAIAKFAEEQAEKERIRIQKEETMIRQREEIALRETALLELHNKIAELDRIYNENIKDKDPAEIERLSDELNQGKINAKKIVEKKYKIKLSFNNKYMIGGGFSQTSEDIEFNNGLLSATSDEYILTKYLKRNSNKIRGSRKF